MCTMRRSANVLFEIIQQEVSAEFPEIKAVYLEAEFDALDDDIGFVNATTGEKHLVSIQCGNAYVSLNRSDYTDDELSYGIRLRKFYGSWAGGLYRTCQYEETITAILKHLRDHRGAYEPKAGPGTATHPLSPAICEAILPVATEALLTVTVDSADPDHPDNDLFRFVADGEVQDVAVATRPGGAKIVRCSDGSTIGDFDRGSFDKLAATTAAVLAETRRPPAP
jgi:hypothetical protein